MSPVVQKLPSHVFALKLLTSQNEKRHGKGEIDLKIFF
jgi:hypothetical protein